MKKTKEEEMFLQNKYSNWYFKIIDNAICQERVKNDSNYYEKHHITPRSIGGADTKENLVLLTAREHYVCHWLLIKFTFGINKSKMIYAFRGINNQKNKYQKRYFNSYGYEYSRKEFNKFNTGENHPSFGKKISIEKRKEQSERLKGNKNPFYGKKHSEETKKKISEKNSKPRPQISGKNNPMYGKIGNKNGKRSAPSIFERQQQSKRMLEDNPSYKEISLEKMKEAITECLTMQNASKKLNITEKTFRKKIHNHGYKDGQDFKQRVLNEKE